LLRAVLSFHRCMTLIARHTDCIERRGTSSESGTMAIKTNKMNRRVEVTIPAAIRKAPDLREGDVFVKRDDNRIVRDRAREVADRAAGAFAKHALKTPLSAAEARA